MSATYYTIGQSRAALIHDRYTDRKVDVSRAHPGVIILVHGVNDVGVSYKAQEDGLCQGLNERLHRDDLVPGAYTLPKRDDALLEDPDAVYYRRNAGDKSRSPVIPFYWGYRASATEVDAKKRNGQNVDVHGNRLDKNFAVAGGMFANATSDIPSMFSGNYVRTQPVVALEALGGDVYHPLRTAADRRYMILAAKRLAMLVAEIRRINPNETVTLVAHSQGCMLSLLAQAFLAEAGKRSADCLIMNHPPYSLHEQWMDRAMQGSDALQQTTRARVETLINLVNYITATPHPEPALAALADVAAGKGCTGWHWTPHLGKRPDPAEPGKEIVFTERDNRGKVYLYFCPDDQTVGLYNVQGIGTLGVPQTVTAVSAQGTTTTLQPFAQLGPRFFQRVWTRRNNRDNKPEPVGLPPYRYKLVKWHEAAYPDATNATIVSRVRPDGEERIVNGEELAPPCIPNLNHGEPAGAKGKLNVDPIDASIAVANGGLQSKSVRIDDTRLALRDVGKQRALLLDADETRRVEEAINRGRKAEPEDQRKLIQVVREADQKLTVTFLESPNEARLRHQSKEQMDNSYHSSIVGNPEHSRLVTAMDVAIGQARTLDDPGWRLLLSSIADWRIAFDQLEKISEYSKLSDEARKLVEATCIYYATGVFPSWIMPQAMPAGVVSETRERQEQIRLQRAEQRTQQTLQQFEEEHRRRIDARNKDRQRAGLPPLPY